MDVISLIIDNVDDRGTLFSLLTVSKDVFHHTCKVLYRDPMRFFRGKFGLLVDPEGTLQNRVSLLRLLVNLSPASDSDTNKLREGLDLPQRREPQTTAPSETVLDYLSFVQCLGWEGSLKKVISPNVTSAFNDWCPPLGRAQSHVSFVKSIITWSLCGHRLDQITELKIEPADIERYIAAASQLRRLRIIIIAAFDSASISDGVVSGIPGDTYSSTVRLFEALQHHHGKHLVRDCRFSPLVASNVPEFVTEWDAQIRMKLPPLIPHDLKLVHPPRPMDSYLSRLVMLTMFEDRWCIRHKPEMLNDYSDMPIGTILQRCRSLIYLNFTLDRSELGGATMFAWAAHEAKEREAGRLLAPPVALEELRLSVDSRYGVGVPRILMDAMHGFALTLYSLYVDCTFFDMEDFGEDHDEDDKNDDEEGMSLLSKPDDAPIVMHKLNSFVFESHDNKLLDTRLFQFCPRLTSLSVNLTNPEADFPSRWPALHLPCLTKLMLFGRATTLFDEASFHGMRRLQTIILDDTTGNMIFAADSPGFLDFWTWDWHLPELTYFKASLVSSKTKFNFRMLRCFPKLAKLCLDFRTLENMPPHQTELLSVLPNVAGDNFPALEILEMSGSYILHEEDLRFLMGPAFSSLREFSMEIPGSCTVGHVLAHTRDHPSLENVKFLNRDNFPDEAMQKQLGLTLYDSDGGGASADRSCSYTFEIDDYKSATYILK